MPPPGLLGLITRGAGALGQRLAATQQPQAPTTPQAPDPTQRALFNALVNPNMPIEAGFRTPSEKTNADLERQARIRNQLLAGRSAIIERARLQGRQVGIDPNTGAPIISGPVTQQLVNGQLVGVRPSGLLESQVMTTPTGQRFVFDREGRVVGTNAPVSMLSDRPDLSNVDRFGNAAMLPMDAVDRAAFNQGQGTVSEQRRLSPAIQQAFQQALRGSMASPAATGAAAAPATAAPTATATAAPAPAAPYTPSPATRALMAAPMPAALAAVSPPLATAARPVPLEQAVSQAEQFIAEETPELVPNLPRQQRVAQAVANTEAEIQRELQTGRDRNKLRQLLQRARLLKSGPREVQDMLLEEAAPETPPASRTPATQPTNPPTTSGAVAASTPSPRPLSPEEVRKNLFDIAAATQAVRREQAAANPPAERGFFAPIRDFFRGSPELSNTATSGAAPAVSWARRLAIRDAFQRGELTEAEASRLLGGM